MLTDEPIPLLGLEVHYHPSINALFLWMQHSQTHCFLSLLPFVPLEFEHDLGALRHASIIRHLAQMEEDLSLTQTPHKAKLFEDLVHMATYQHAVPQTML
jgi:hypothetical protein